MILYAVRHGQTEKNKYGLVQGQTEADLNEVGIKEAEKLQPLVDSLNIDVVISSPLRRAKDTARIITSGKMPINTDDRLIERDWGMCEGACIDDVDTVKCWNFYLNTDANRIEKVQDLLKRISEFLEDIKVRYKDKNVLIVTHSAILRALHYCLRPIPEDGDMSKLDIPNLRIIEYELK
ncbi:MAG: histidine phosphatase family protein [Bacilli bacterium]|nr:histidine phosphatase family protein [Bacilli bacterium]